MPKFSRWKSGRVSRLVCYGAPARFQACVCGVCQHARARTSRSPLKHHAYWCMSHTRGNWCHLMTWIGIVTSRWLCTQYSMSMHLRQLPWAHTHTTRLRALMAREGRSRSHKGPSYKVHYHPYTSIYRYTYIMHNPITQRRKVKQTLPTSQGYSRARYRKCKTNIAIPRECDLSKEQEDKGYMERGTLIHCIFLLASLPFFLAPSRSHPCPKCPYSKCVHAMTKETSQHTSKETTRRKSC